MARYNPVTGKYEEEDELARNPFATSSFSLQSTAAAPDFGRLTGGQNSQQEAQQVASDPFKAFRSFKTIPMMNRTDNSLPTAGDAVKRDWQSPSQWAATAMQKQQERGMAAQFGRQQSAMSEAFSATRDRGAPPYDPVAEARKLGATRGMGPGGPFIFSNYGFASTGPELAANRDDLPYLPATAARKQAEATTAAEEEKKKKRRT